MKLKMMNFRVSEEEKLDLEKKAKKAKFRSVSEYIRFVSLNSEIEVKRKTER